MVPASVEMTFEEALKRLEAIVGEMEDGELPLEALMARYEEGSKLATLCQARLGEAELKLQQIEQAADGGLSVKDLKLDSAEPAED